MSRPRHTPGIAVSPACSVATSPCALPGAAGGGATFNPADYGTATHWWHQGSGIYSDAGSTPVVDTDPVYQWNDAIGSSNLVQATLAARPQYSLANGWLSFDATDDVLSVGAAVGDVGAMLVVLDVGTAVENDVVVAIANSDAVQHKIRFESDANYGEYVISQIDFGGVDGNTYVNGVDSKAIASGLHVVAVRRVSAVITSQRFDLGMFVGTGGSASDISVAEVVTWSDAVSEENIVAASQAAMTKHGIA